MMIDCSCGERFSIRCELTLWKWAKDFICPDCGVVHAMPGPILQVFRLVGTEWLRVG
jgi:hypothetical protein